MFMKHTLNQPNKTNTTIKTKPKEEEENWKGNFTPRIHIKNHKNDYIKNKWQNEWIGCYSPKYQKVIWSYLSIILNLFLVEVLFWTLVENKP